MAVSLKSWRHLTPYLLFCCVVFMQGALLFGIDTGSFGSLQALPSFLEQFGTKNAKGKYALPATQKSLMNSLPWIGKILGCLGAEFVIEHVGFKKTMYIVSVIQVVAVILEVSAHHWSQFTVGRIVAYFAVGLVENAAPSYNSEVSPAATRGLLGGSLIMISSLGNLWGAGMSRAYVGTSGNKGWIIPTSMQFIPAVGLMALVPFTVESPRWLLLKKRKPDAKKSLDRLRTKAEVESGAVDAELNAIEQLVEESLEAESGSWLDLFRGNYLVRTWITATLFIIEQSNGNQFVQSYAATFYVQEGWGSMSFTYTTLGQVVGFIGAAAGVFLFDVSGRRPLFIYGSAIATFLLYLASGLGQIKNPNTDEAHTILSCFILLPAFVRISASNCAFLTGAEIGGVRMRKKMMAFGTACDVAAAFLITFVTPYLLPSMGVNIGWIFGSVAAFSVIWGILFFPELKGRSLEEVDELFNAKLKAWQFKKYQTHGTGHLITLAEDGKLDMVGAKTESERIEVQPKSHGEKL